MSTTAPRDLHSHVQGHLPELYGLGRRFASRSGAPDSPDASDLVHEGILKLIRTSRRRNFDAEHFLATARSAIRQVAIDDSRRRTAQKRHPTGSCLNTPAHLVDRSVNHESTYLVRECLDRLQEIDHDLGKLAELHCLQGMCLSDCATHLGVSSRTITRKWKRAKRWLQAQLAA